MPITLAGAPNTVKTNGSGGTTPAMNSASPLANLIVLAISAPIGDAYVQGKDSLNNTWVNPAAAYSNTAGTNRTGAPHVLAPVTGASHTFTNQLAVGYQGIIAAAFAGVASMQVESGVSNNPSGTSHPTAVGTLTPSQDGALLVSVFAPSPGASTGPVTAPEGFTILDNTIAGWGVYFAFEIQTTATPRTPTWTTGSGVASAGTSKVFLPAAGGGGPSGSPWYYNAQQ